MAAKFIDRTADFLLQEHELLRKEIMQLIDEVRTVERNVLVAIGVTWGFLVRYQPLRNDRWEWFVPSFFVVVGIIRTWAIHKAFEQFSDYLRRTEAEFTTAGDPPGWESFLLGQPKIIARSWVVSSIVILGITVFVGIYKWKSYA